MGSGGLRGKGGALVFRPDSSVTLLKVKGFKVVLCLWIAVGGFLSGPWFCHLAASCPNSLILHFFPYEIRNLSKEKLGTSCPLHVVSENHWVLSSHTAFLAGGWVWELRLAPAFTHEPWGSFSHIVLILLQSCFPISPQLSGCAGNRDAVTLMVLS